MGFGPIELLVVSFPRDATGDVGHAVRSLVDSGTIRIIDVVFVTKDRDGKVTSKEIVEFDDRSYATFDPLVEDVAGLLKESDVEWLARMMEPDTSAGMMLFEHTLAGGFAEAVRHAGGKVLMAERIPRRTIEELTAERAAA
jgi:Family of unknown function (DUF6325)